MEGIGQMSARSRMRRAQMMYRFMPGRREGDIVRIGKKYYKVWEALFGFVKLFRYYPNRLPQGREHYASEERLWNRNRTKQNSALSGSSWMNTPHL